MSRGDWYQAVAGFLCSAGSVLFLVLMLRHGRTQATRRA